MPEQVTNYKCPACTGPLHFNGEAGKLECDYCGSSFDVATIEQLYADQEQAAAAAGKEPEWDSSAAGGEWAEEEKANMRSYTCPSCGAELICDATTAATSCPYCGNPTVVPGQFSGTLRPDFIVPFKLDKESAEQALRNYYKGKKFLPNSFRSENHIEEIRGVYVPFWLFNCEADADMRYRAERVHSFRQGKEEVIVTEHFRVTRQGDVHFERIPVDGSTKMPDAHMDSIEPFDYSELKPFSSAYLPGFLADKYDVDAEKSSERANARIKTSTEEAFEKTVGGYTSCSSEYSDIKLRQGDVKYALLPVWMLNTKWKEKDYLFAMNGQTGKLVGNLPVDKGKFFKWFAGISLPLMAILGVALFLL